MSGGVHPLKWTLCALLVAACSHSVAAQDATADPEAQGCRGTVTQSVIQKTPFGFVLGKNSTITDSRGNKFNQQCFTITTDSTQCQTAGYKPADCCVSSPFTMSQIFFPTAPACSGNPSKRSFRKSWWSLDPTATKKSSREISASLSSNFWRIRVKRKTTIGTAGRQLCFNIAAASPNVCPTIAEACQNAICKPQILSSRYTADGNNRKQSCCIFPTINAREESNKTVPISLTISGSTCPDQATVDKIGQQLADSQVKNGVKGTYVKGECVLSTRRRRLSEVINTTSPKLVYIIVFSGQTEAIDSGVTELQTAVESGDLTTAVPGLNNTLQQANIDVTQSCVEVVCSPTCTAPCQNGGSCVFGDQCLCAAGFTGTRCETALPPNTVGPGQYYSPSANQILPCPTGTFNPNTRSVSGDLAGAATCISCSSLVAFRAPNAIAGIVYGLQAAGSGGTSAGSCSCPANTFLQLQSTTAAACTACPTGTTSGGSGATSESQCLVNNLAGYYGDPANPAYGVGTSCPTTSPGNSLSSTAGTTAAPTTAASCSTCSAGSFANTTSAPAVCYACGGNTAAPAGSASCTLCKVGFFGPGCTSPCPSKYPVNPAKTSLPSQSDSEEDACGPGCTAGFTGSDCTVKCEVAANLKTVRGKAAQSVGGSDWVTPAVGTFNATNCVYGCPPGKGYDYDSDSCKSCASDEFSAGATAYDGVNFFAAWPVCQKCPSGSQPADGNSRCVVAAAAPANLFDEFD